MKKIVVAFGILAAGVMVTCSSPPPSTAPAEQPRRKVPEAITGSSAFFKCYVSARLWATDAQPYRLESEPTNDSKGRDGKAGEWRAYFASPAKHTTRPYTWALGDVSHSVEDAYSPNNSSTQIFNVQFLKTDADKAFALAQEHGGEKLLQQEPDTPVLYVLEWDHLVNKLLWHVIYGTDRETAKLRVAVDATTGEFWKVEK